MNKINRLISGSLLVACMLSLIACGGGESTEEDQQSIAEANEEPTITTQAPETKLNINTASEEEFRTIPGVGDKMEHEFEEYRPYVSIQQFRKEIGKYVDEDQVAVYEQYIFVPVEANESDAASLQQLPGVDADEAQKLIDGRPYESNEAFIEKLTSYVNEEELATAKTYLNSQ